MIILKWIGFLLVSLDTVAYIIQKGKNLDKVSSLTALCLGIAARVYTLYGTAAYWLFT